MVKGRTGTREWARYNVNIQIGCKNGCRYCYARYNAVKRFKNCTAEEWLEPVIIQSNVAMPYPKRQGVGMYPSRHDITPRNLSDSVRVLHKLLDAGNEVLLVSKPHIDCIRQICDAFRGYRKQLSLRFTIGSMDDRVLSFWEPNAPGFNERTLCLEHAFESGFQTSVSCEPFLDCVVDNISGSPFGLFTVLKPYIKDSFWIGKLNQFDERVDMTGVTSEQEERFVKPLKAAQSDEMIYTIYRQLQDEPLIRWKDSFREVIEK